MGVQWQMLSQDRLRKLIYYDPTTGLFTRFGRAESQHPDRDGYVRITVYGAKYMAARLAWLYVYGEPPSTQVDHVNGIPSDNRIENLREATPSENRQNQKAALSTNQTRLLGVSRNGSRYSARIMVRGKRIYIGTYDTPEEAHEAYLRAKRIHHPFGTI